MKVLKIEICSLRNRRLEYAYDVRVDRASVLGNRFVMRSEVERNTVCDLYKEYFDNMVLQTKGMFMDGSPDLAKITKFADAATLKRFSDELNTLIYKALKFDKLRLFCWCAPKRCHAETIALYVANELADFFDKCVIEYI